MCLHKRQEEEVYQITTTSPAMFQTSILQGSNYTQHQAHQKCYKLTEFRGKEKSLLRYGRRGQWSYDIFFFVWGVLW